MKKPKSESIYAIQIELSNIFFCSILKFQHNFDIMGKLQFSCMESGYFKNKYVC